MTATDANAILPDAIRIPPQLAGAVAMAASSPAPPTEAITPSYTNVRRTDPVFTIDQRRRRRHRHPRPSRPAQRTVARRGHELMTPRLATVTEAGTVACLLDRFNREVETPTPGVAVLTARLQRLLAGPSMFAILTGESAVGVALVSLRANAWYDGPVALLDELFVVSEHRNREGRSSGVALQHRDRHQPGGVDRSLRG